MIPQEPNFPPHEGSELEPEQPGAFWKRIPWELWAALVALAVSISVFAYFIVPAIADKQLHIDLEKELCETTGGEPLSCPENPLPHMEVCLACACPEDMEWDVAEGCVRGESTLGTSTWRTYRNEEFGFEVRYPRSWVRGENSIRFTDDTQEGSYTPQDSPDIRVSFFAVENSSGEGLQVIFDKRHKKCLLEVESGKDSFGCPFRRNTETWQEVVVDSRPALRSGRETASFSEVDSVYISLPGGHFFVIEADFWNDDPELEHAFDRILSTFTFINPVDTSDWQTYRNEEFGFEVRYPRSWQARSTFRVIFKKYANAPEELQSSDFASTQTKTELVQERFRIERRETVVNPYELSEFVELEGIPMELSTMFYVESGLFIQEATFFIENDKITIQEPLPIAPISSARREQNPGVVERVLLGISTETADPEVLRHVRDFRQVLSTFRFIQRNG